MPTPGSGDHEKANNKAQPGTALAWIQTALLALILVEVLYIDDQASSANLHAEQTVYECGR
jgi:hypothetical protein